MDHQNIEANIRQLLTQITLNKNFLHLPADQQLHASGLDSVGVIEFIYALEEHFNIQIAEDDVLPENFESIEVVTRLISAKNGHKL